MGIWSQAKWITAKRYGKQMPVFGRDLFLKKQPAKAEIHICGLGQFALFVEGKEVNEGVYEPGWTNYRKTCLYSTYDVTAFLNRGKNRLRVMIGNGMYHVDGERYVKFTGSFGDPLLIMALCVTYEDGTAEEFVTDGEWSCCPGPVMMSCIYGGEDYDASVCGWKAAISEGKAEWIPAAIYEGPVGALKKAGQPQVRIQKELQAVDVCRLEDGRIRYDFGRNFAGRIKIKAAGEKGQQVIITPGELLLGDGSINQEFTGDPHYYVYTLSGEGEETWMPRFTYYGQRYALIRTDARILEVTGQEQYASCPETGYFKCSNEMYNRIHEIIVGAIRSNMQSVFTDCPHREKLGWLEETHLIGPGILADFDAKKLFEKILDDMEDSQTPEGLVPSICPEFVQFDLGFRDSPEWGSASVLLPWYLYKKYGDRQLLEKHYGLSERYVAYLLSKARNGILNYGLGDWLDVGHYPSHPANTPIPVTATAILYQDLTVMAETAGVLGRKEEEEHYRKLAQDCRKAFNEAFFYPLSKNYANGSQTANAMALFLELPEEEYREPVLQNLEEDIRLKGGHFTGGDVGHPYILRALAKYGRNDIIAENFMKTDFPSYGYQVSCNATTLCEDWDGPNPEHPVMSQNHFMLGAAEEWFYCSLAGIRADASARERIRIQPCFPEGVDWVDCRTLTPAGMCRVYWERKEEYIRVEVTLEKEERICLSLNGEEEIVKVQGSLEREVRVK